MTVRLISSAMVLEALVHPLADSAEWWVVRAWMTDWCAANGCYYAYTDDFVVAVVVTEVPCVVRL